MQTQEQIQLLPLESIQAARQVREQFDETSLQGLAASLESGRLQQPIRVRKTGNGYIIIDGERRSRAARMAGWKTIPAIIEQAELSESDILEQQLVANCQREDLTPLEKARGIQRLLEVTRENNSQVSQKLGVSQATVSRLLTLLTLPLQIQDQIETGEIPASAGYELAKVSNPTEQSALASQLASQELTRDGIAARQRQQRAQAASSEQSISVLNRAVALLGRGESVSVTGSQLDLQRFIELLEAALHRAKKGRQRGISLQTHLKVLRDEAKSLTLITGLEGV